MYSKSSDLSLKKMETMFLIANQAPQLIWYIITTIFELQFYTLFKPTNNES